MVLYPLFDELLSQRRFGPYGLIDQLPVPTYPYTRVISKDAQSQTSNYHSSERRSDPLTFFPQPGSLPND